MQKSIFLAPLLFQVEQVFSKLNTKNTDKVYKVHLVSYGLMKSSIPGLLKI
jgi:hypothetical protein